MNKISLLAILVSVVAVSAAESPLSPPSPDYPLQTIANSQLRVLPKTVSDRTYQLHVGLPPSYLKEPNRKYPVVYITDGYWDFIKMAAIRPALLNDRVVPEFIIVGLGYAGEKLDYQRLRLRDLSPLKVFNIEESGHAAEFLQTVAEQVIPFVEREYRADPAHRVLMGASAGGLFTLYAMYSKPDLFNAWVAATPASFFAKDDWLLNYEKEFAQASRQLKGRLYVTVGGNEGGDYIASILRYNRRVVSRKYADLAYDFRIIEGERHAGGQIEAYVRGLRFVFAPIAPETGPSPRDP